jgi:hypothetical protein
LPESDKVRGAQVEKPRVDTLIGAAIGIAALLMPTAAQTVDPVDTGRGPIVALDGAHGNTASTAARDKPFADLLTGDGYRVVTLDTPFAYQRLATVDVLVVSAESSEAPSAAGRSPSGRLGDPEADLVRDWVRGGGSLLLAAAAPASVDTAGQLAERFGVSAGGGRVFDRLAGAGITTALEFSRRNGLLGEHPIVRGPGKNAQIARVRSAAGQSLGVPRGATILLKLSPTAREAMTRDDLESEEYAARQEAGIAGSFSVPVAGRAQAVALPVGKGRLVVLGDPYLLSAAGLSATDADNRQFALNVIHWLSRRW